MLRARHIFFRTFVTKITCLSQGANFTMSLDGHDNLCRFQKSMFPLCIYGGLNAFSRRVKFLRIWTSNSNPKIIGWFYFDYIAETKGMLHIKSFNYLPRKIFTFRKDSLTFSKENDSDFIRFITSWNANLSNEIYTYNGTNSSNSPT